MSPLRVLIVDDNKDAASSLGRLLGVLGKETRIVHDGTTALQAIPDFRPHVVLLDLGLPGIDGVETARQIRAAAGGEKVILIAVTGWGGTEDRRRTQEAGFAAHLVKPIKVELLESTLSDVLQTHLPGGFN
jgi:CheY-like chemotaxis protein